MGYAFFIDGKGPARPWKEIDCFNSRKKAAAMLPMYAAAYGTGWKFRIVRRWAR